MKVEIWSDIMCPFCYIGKRNFESALAQFPGKNEITVEWKSFQLDPSIPEQAENHDDIFAYLAERKGMSYEQSKKMHENVAKLAEGAGLDYHFEKAKVANSLKAHRIIQLAKTRGLGDTAEERFFRAYFTEGVDLGSEEELLRLGVEIGLSESDIHESLSNSAFLDKTKSDIAEAQQLGISGVPFFVLNRKYGISGAQPAADMLKSLDVAFSEWKKNAGDKPFDATDGMSCDIDGNCE